MKSQIIDSTNPLWMQVLHQFDHDFYHLPEFLNLEADRLQASAEAILIQEHENLFFLPYLRRQWGLGNEEKRGWDVVSAYGYPGFLVHVTGDRADFINRAIATLTQVWQERGICSAFLRLHPILNAEIEQDLADHPALQVSGTTVSIDLSPSLETLWKQTRENHRRGIRRLKQAGFSVGMLPLAADLEAFIAIYEETMDRVGAKPTYYFSQDYFMQLMHALGPRLHLCGVQFNQTLVAASLITEVNGIVQYHLGGTANDFLKAAPAKLIFDYVRTWAKERGNACFHLGGGLGAAQDSLYLFKAGFANQVHPFSTLRLVVNPAQYDTWITVAADRSHQTPAQLLQTHFFPAYRALE